MKISRKNSKRRSRSLKKTAKRLAAYSAAAGATVMTPQNSANALDVVYDISDVVSDGTTDIRFEFINGGVISESATTSNYQNRNTAPASFGIGNYGNQFYGPVGDSGAGGAGFANPATCFTSLGAPSCGTGFGSTYVFPLALPLSSPVSVGKVFAGAIGFNPTYGNSAGLYYLASSYQIGGFVGVRFNIDASLHYGWAQLTNGADGTILHGFGYNTVPGDPSITVETRDIPGDFDNNKVLDADDWVTIRDNGFTDLSGETPETSYPLGDMNGDLEIDINDYDLFRAAYAVENPGSGAFAAMVAAAAVPEPSSIMLLASGAAGLGMWRKKRTG